MQMVILAGGLATRLRPITSTIPKSMVPVCGKPFLEYQIELIRQHGIAELVLCVGHLWEQIEAHFGDGRHFGVKIHYSVEQGPLLGTAGALAQACPLLNERFYVMYGDSFLLYPYEEIMDRSRGYDALMVVYHNRGRFDASNVAVRDGRIVRYEKGSADPELDHIDAGLLVLTARAIAGLTPGQPASLDRDVVPSLVEDGHLAAYITPQRFYEIGSPSGLEEFTKLVKEKGFAFVGRLP